MDTWTLQTGYPVLSVSFTGGGATLTQERFMMEKPESSGASTHDYKWWIPITFTTQESTDFSNTVPSSWMSKDESTKDIENVPAIGWKIFNLHQTGYHRVNYDVVNWRKLVAQLKTDHTVFPVTNRAQLLDDSFNL